MSKSGSSEGNIVSTGRSDIERLVPNRGMASDTWGKVSATRFRNTVNDSKMVTPATEHSLNTARGFWASASRKALYQNIKCIYLLEYQTWRDAVLLNQTWKNRLLLFQTIKAKMFYPNYRHQYYVFNWCEEIVLDLCLIEYHHLTFDTLPDNPLYISY